MSEYNSSMSEIDFFIGSTVCEDLMEELKSWMNDVRELQDGLDSWEEACRCQGRVDVIKRLLLWPEVVRDQIESDVNDGENL